MPEIFKVLAANVRRLRRDREWTADDLAARVSLDRAAIDLIEAGGMNIDIDQLDELADALGVDASELVKPSNAMAG